MRSWPAVAVIALVTGFVVMLGVRRWQREQAPLRAVHRFLQALQAGDRRTAAQMLAPHLQQGAGDRLASADDWSSLEGIEYQVIRFRIQGEKVIVQAMLAASGERQRADFVLILDERQEWKILEIKLPLGGVDATRNADPKSENDLELQRELTEALAPLQGVEVQRTARREP